MGNFPFSLGHMPGGDPPYPMTFRRDGKVVLESANYGDTTTPYAEPEVIANAVLEEYLEKRSRVISESSDYTDNHACFSFHIKDGEINDIFLRSLPKNKDHVEIMKNVVKSMKKMMSLLAFL